MRFVETPIKVITDAPARARRKARRSTPEAKARAKAIRDLPENKAKRKVYNAKYKSVNKERRNRLDRERRAKKRDERLNI